MFGWIYVYKNCIIILNVEINFKKLQFLTLSYKLIFETKSIIFKNSKKINFNLFRNENKLISNPKSLESWYEVFFIGWIFYDDLRKGTSKLEKVGGFQCAMHHSTKTPSWDVPFDKSQLSLQRHQFKHNYHFLISKNVNVDALYIMLNWFKTTVIFHCKLVQSTILYS